MPYCPKCDMEFVEGVAVCTDCGGPLFESKEAAEAFRRSEKERQEEEMRKRFEEIMAQQEQLKKETEDETASWSSSPEDASHVYVTKRQLCEDMSSSATAFFMISAVLFAATAVIFIGLLKIPSGPMNIALRILLPLMAVGSFMVGISSRRSVKGLKDQADDEERLTEEVLQWFLKTYSADDLDNQLLAEDPGLSGEELSLKRLELIQDYLVTGRDLPDPSFVDALCDMLYTRLYEEV